MKSVSRSWFRTALVLCILGSVAVTTGLSRAADGQGPKYVWKVGTLAPKGMGWANQVEKVLLPEIQQACQGELYLKVYWGGVMGDDEDYIKKMRIGQLQAAGITAQGAIQICPEWAVVELPFLFRGYEEVDHVKARMTDSFDRLMEEKGFKLIVWIDQDFDLLYSVKWPIVSVEDFKKSRIVTWYGPLEERLLQNLGASPVPVNVPEIPTALRQGVVDANIAPSMWMVGTQLYSVARYVNTMNIRYAPALIIVTMEAWNELPKPYREELLARRQDVTQRFTAGTREESRESLKAMIQYGLRVANPNEQQLARIKERALPVYDQMVGKLYTRALLDELLGHIAEFRAQNEPPAD